MGFKIILTEHSNSLLKPSYKLFCKVTLFYPKKSISPPKGIL